MSLRSSTDRSEAEYLTGVRGKHHSSLDLAKETLVTEQIAGDGFCSSSVNATEDVVEQNDFAPRVQGSCQRLV